MDSKSIETSRLAEYVAESVEHEEEFHFLRFESLQRLNIVSLEVDLARFKTQLLRQTPISLQDLGTLRTKLRQYSRWKSPPRGEK